jgi:hypothetical protein
VGGTRVVGRLQQAGHYRGLERRDRHSLGFEANISRIGQAVGLPPCALLALPGQNHHPVALSLVGYTVELAEVPDIPEHGNAPASLHPAHLAWRAQQMLGYLLNRQPLIGAKGAEQRA